MRNAGEEKTEQSRIEEMVKELSTALHNIKREQVFLEVRERTHRLRTSIMMLWRIIITYALQ